MNAARSSTKMTSALEARSGARRHPRLLALLASALLSLGAVLGVGAVSPAAAATYSPASVCFKHTNGAAFTYDVYAQYWTGSGWANAQSKRSVNGCTSWNLQTGYYWKFQAFYRVGTSYWMGNSTNYLIKSGYSYNYGAYYVYQY